MAETTTITVSDARPTPLTPGRYQPSRVRVYNRGPSPVQLVDDTGAAWDDGITLGAGELIELTTDTQIYALAPPRTPGPLRPVVVCRVEDL